MQNLQRSVKHDIDHLLLLETVRLLVSTTDILPIDVRAGGSCHARGWPDDLAEGMEHICCAEKRQYRVTRRVTPLLPDVNGYAAGARTRAPVFSWSGWLGVPAVRQ